MAINKTINKSTKSHGAMRNCIEYVLQTDKTERELVGVTGPFAADEINYDTVYQSFLDEKKMWNKDSGRMYAHNVISWHKDEDISLQQARDFGKAFAEKWFQGFQTLYTVHKEREHIHVHFITNTVSYEDGRKLHNSKKDMERMKALTNKMSEERGLTVTEKGVDFHGNELEEGHVRAWNKDKYHLFLNDKKKSHVADCALAVLESKEISTYREMFIREMNQRGWKVIWKDKRKNITFENAEGKKVRASNLSKTFNMDITKETLINEFKRQARRRSRDIEKYNGEDAGAFIGKLRSEERAGKQEQYHKEAGRQDREDARERSDWKIRELKYELSQNHKDLNERLKEEYETKNIELDKEADRLCLGFKAVFGWILTYHLLIIIVTAIQSGVFIKHVIEFLDDTFYAAYCVVMTILELDWLIKIILLVTLVVIGFFLFKWLRLEMKNISGKMRLEDILPIPVVVLITMIYFAEGISSVVSINLYLLYILLIGFYFLIWIVLLMENDTNKIYWLHIMNVVVFGVILVVWGISAFIDMIGVLRY